jgi:hypothetical protein
LDDFEAPVTFASKIIQKAFALARKRRFRALVLQNGLRPHSSAQTSISRTAMRSGNVILKVLSSKNFIFTPTTNTIIYYVFFNRYSLYFHSKLIEITSSFTSFAHVLNCKKAKLFSCFFFFIIYNVRLRSFREGVVSSTPCIRAGSTCVRVFFVPTNSNNIIFYLLARPYEM